MAVDKKVRAKYYNLCDPRQAIGPDDERYVDASEARGRDWVRGLAARIELSDGPVYELVTGLPGAGKSTDLRRLKARLEDPGGAHLLVVLIDAEEVTDLYSTIDVPDVLMAVLAMTERRVIEAEGKDRTHDSPARFWSWLTSTELSLKGVEIGLPDAWEASVGARVVLDMKTRPRLREEVRRILDDQLPSFVARVREALHELDERARAAGYAGLAVVFDSLEKLYGTTSSWREVVQSAERVFSARASDLRLPVHAVYTIPMSVIRRTTSPVTLVPMLGLYDRDGRRTRGFDIAREIVRRRVPDEVLDVYFGGAKREAHVERLIAFSGGIPREIVRLLQHCVAERDLDERTFEGILGMAGDEYRRVVLGSEHPLLARIAVEKRLPSQEGERDMIDRLLQNGLILAYQNGEVWYDVHPAARTISGVATAIEKLGGERPLLA